MSVRVTLLTQEHCDFCDQAKALLDRLAAEYPLRVEVVDLATPEGAGLAQWGGILFAPGVFIDGEPFSYGRPSERRLRRELHQRLMREETRA
jgi:glutaredoxin